MKKIILALILLPFFASATPDYQESENTQDGVYQSQSELPQALPNSEVEMMGRGHRVRCGSRSDNKCVGKFVFDTCERDPSHGIYGSCRDIGRNGSEAICTCYP